LFIYLLNREIIAIFNCSFGLKNNRIFVHKYVKVQVSFGYAACCHVFETSVLDLVLTVTSLPVSPLLTSNSTDIFFFVSHLSEKMSLNGTTPEHPLKCRTTVCLYLKKFPHAPQIKCLISECVGL